MMGSSRSTQGANRFPVLDHLLVMSDDVGILQHATLDIPNRSCGYCTDDVGRALIVAIEGTTRYPQQRDVARLVTTYLAYLHDAQLPDGWFHNFMGYDRRWQDESGAADAVGRAIWGLGYAERHAPRQSWRALAGTLRRRALPALARMEHIRSHAYTLLGLVESLGARPDDELVLRRAIDTAASAIASAYDVHHGPDWEWCEDIMTYDNARLPEALMRAGGALGNRRYVDIGLAMLEFYAEVTIENGIFQPVGNMGWYPRGGVKARFGQQPLEAAAMCEAALVAHALTGEAAWRGIAECAHEWFLGANVLGVNLVRDGGCCDGLDAGGANPNAGAESTVAYLMSAIELANRSSTTLRVAQ